MKPTALYHKKVMDFCFVNQDIIALMRKRETMPECDLLFCQDIQISFDGFINNKRSLLYKVYFRYFNIKDNKKIEDDFIALISVTNDPVMSIEIERVIEL